MAETKFEYACFISYRNSKQGREGLLSTFARELCRALEGTLDAYLREDLSEEYSERMVFLDEHEIETGEFIPNVIGNAICRSICWIVVFTRNYLGGPLWCASELKGMLEIEEKRLSHMNSGSKPERGFIIPILFKAEKADMPISLRNRAYERELKKFSLSVKDITDHPQFIEIVEEIAAIIAKTEGMLINTEKNFCQSCESFSLHDVNDQNHLEALKEFVKTLDFQTQEGGPYTPKQPIS